MLVQLLIKLIALFLGGLMVSYTPAMPPSPLRTGDWAKDFHTLLSEQPEEALHVEPAVRSGGAGEYTHFYELSFEAIDGYLRVYTKPYSEKIRFYSLWMWPENEAETKAARADSTLSPLIRSAVPLIQPAGTLARVIPTLAPPPPSLTQQEKDALFLKLATLLMEACEPELSEGAILDFAQDMEDAFATVGKKAILEGETVQFLAGSDSFAIGEGLERTVRSILVTPLPDDTMDGNRPSFAAWQTTVWGMEQVPGAAQFTWDDPILSAMNDTDRGQMLITGLTGSPHIIASFTDPEGPHYLRGFYVRTMIVAERADVVAAAWEGYELFDALAKEADPDLSQASLYALAAVLEDSLAQLTAGEYTGGERITAPRNDGDSFLTINVETSEPTREREGAYLYLTLDFTYP